MSSTSPLARASPPGPGTAHVAALSSSSIRLSRAVRSATSALVTLQQCDQRVHQHGAEDLLRQRNLLDEHGTPHAGLQVRERTRLSPVRLPGARRPRTVLTVL